MCRNRLEKNLKHLQRSVLDTLPNRREYKRDQACMSEFYKEKNPAYLWLGDFLQNKGGG